MKPFVRFLFGTMLALLAVASVHAAPVLVPAGIASASAGPAPGETVTLTLTVTNSAAAGDDFLAGNTINGSVTFTHKLTGATFSTGSLTFTTSAAVPGDNGSGSLTSSYVIPTKFTEGGAYDATVTLTSASGGASASGSFTSRNVVSVAGKADLQITGLDYAAGTTYVGGNTLTMKVRFKNNQSTNGVQNIAYTPGLNGDPTSVRIKVVLSSNPTFGDADDFQLTIQDFGAGNMPAGITSGTVNVDPAGNRVLFADGDEHEYTWTQILPGNFTGSFYVLAKIDSLDALSENDPAPLTVNGNNIWGGNTLNPAGTLINLLPSNFPTTYLASHGTGSTNTATGYSDNPSISADGRYIAFASDATDLVASNSTGGADTNGFRDIFLYDSQTSTVRRLSVSQQGQQANGASNNPAISADGRYVAFSSEANNLVIGDTNGFSDIYVVDTLTGLISRVSGANASAGQANNPSFRPAISSNGRYIVYESSATNLITSTTTATGVTHVYLYDRLAGAGSVFDVTTSTTLVDVQLADPTKGGNANAIQATISSDASWIGFSSKATDLVTGGTTAGRQHVYVRQRTNVGTTTSGIKLVSVANATAAQGGSDSQTASLSSDGHYVAFASLASNLVTGDTNGVSDIFVYDNTAAVATPVVRRMSVANVTGAQAVDPSSAGFQLGSINPTISSDGRYVAFASLANNLTAGDVNGQSQTNDANNAVDIFVHDRDSAATGTFDTGATATTLVSANPFGYQTNGLLGAASTAASNIYPVISANGRFVAFPSDAENNAGLAFGATNLLPRDSNGLRDVFIADRRTTATVTPATPPTITITSPGNGSQALVNTAITVAASATTTVGQVASVQFFVDGNSLGSTSIFPYTSSWTPTAVGVYNLSALVTDTFGNIGVSANVAVTITAAPSIGLTSPTSGTAITLPLASPVTVAATAAATTPGATITNVKFYANGVQIGATDTTAPYSVQWSPTVTGTYTVTSVATDSNGTTSTSTAVTVTVATAGGSTGGGTNAPPTVVLAKPPETSSVNARVTLSATATAATGLTITNVEFLVDGSVVGSATASPFTTIWTPPAIGVYSIVARATDNQGGVTLSSPAASVNVTGTLSLQITSPVSGAQVLVNTPQTVRANASFTNGTITSVAFFANGTLIGTDNTFPYAVSWTPTTSGTFSLTAIGTDNTGAQIQSTATILNVLTGTAPAVGIVSPVAGSTIKAGSTQTIVANASGGTAPVASVQFFANGFALGTDTTFPYNQTWTPAGPGAVVLTAVVTDTLGNQTATQPVSVTVAAGSETSPTVAIINPTAGTSLPVGAPTTITAAATDPDGVIAGVQFFVNGVSVGTDTQYPYSVNFTPTSVGNYTLTAIATDDGGNPATSAPVVVSVYGGATPTVGIVGPLSGANIDINTPQTIFINANSPNGTISSVTVFANGVVIGTANTFPYTVSWTPAALGTYSLTASVTDNLLNSGTSTPVIVTVGPGSSTLPKVALTSIPTGTRITVNNTVVLAANAEDPDGFITNVDFYVNDRLLGSKAAFPYVMSWIPSNVGTYTIKAIATDNAGNRTTSATAAIQAIAQVGQLPFTNLVFNSPAVDTPTDSSPAINPLVPIKVDYGSKLIVRAAAVKDDGTITNVQFFANGVNIGSLTAAPYFTTYQLNTLSSVFLTALVTDSSGNTVYTQPIIIDPQPSISAAGSVVTLVSPKDGNSYVVGGQITFSATHNFGTVVPPKIDFYVNGSQFTTVTAAVGGTNGSTYQYIVGLTRAGTYTIHAVARAGTTTTISTPARITVTSGRAPAVSITSPSVGSPYTVGTGLTIAANVTSATGLISRVEFFVNGAALSSKNTAPYTAAWNPGSAGTYTLTALATDDSGNQTLSEPVVLTLVGNTPPSVSVTNPSGGSTVNAGNIVNLVASAADSDGTVTSVRFLANGTAVGAAASAAPYSTAWTPTAAGSYSVIAQATDNSGNVTNSAPITVTVTANSAPLVAMTSPAIGAVVRTGVPVTLVSNASDADGTIASVQFFANGSAVGGALTTVSPVGGYRAQFTPTSEGVYRFTAVAIDNAGATTTSSTVIVMAVNASSGGTDSVYNGTYSGSGEIGRFAMINMRGKTAAFIAYSTTTPSKAYYYPGLPLDLTGGFSLSDAQGRTVVSGSVNDTGVSGSLDAGRALFIGPVTFTSSSTAVAAGYFTGSLTGRSNSLLAAIIGPDGSIMLYVSDGSFQAVGNGAVDSSGSFNVLVTGGARFTGKADPATGFLSGSLSGANGGAFMAATSSGAPFSDGFLRNLSTRGQVGTGSNILIGGFVVGGTVPKQVLIRAIGPTLAGFGITGALADPRLDLFSGNTLVVSNDNWAGAGEVVAATDSAGTFPLATNSRDAAVVVKLSPGPYTAQISGVGGTTGVALLELYDVDSQQAFSTQKVMNVATRGVVGTGQGQLIAGFVVSGNTAKKVLIRGVGPTLAASPFNVTGTLPDPVLRLVRGDGLIIRENDNWEAGNDTALINDAATKVGAFPLATGGKDSAMLLNLPPGIYNAQVTGSGSTTGVALIEVYEVP